MIELRDMQLILALARHRHFARAARECGISQPAFSMRIRGLERALGVSIVKRGNRLQGFTEEGEIVLRWARRLTDDARALAQEVQSARGVVSGRLTVGVIPTALAYAARVPLLLAAGHPGIVVRSISATSLQIQQEIEQGTMDAGITYEDGVPADMMDVLPLYRERYVLLAPGAIAPRAKGSASWAEAAALPLSLLEPGMQNRRILDRQFADTGQVPRVVAETNAFSASLHLVREGFAATIVPEVLAAAQDDLGGAVALPLAEPEIAKSICLVSAAREPRLPTVEALRRVLAADVQ